MRFKWNKMIHKRSFGNCRVGCQPILDALMLEPRQYPGTEVPVGPRRNAVAFSVMIRLFCYTHGWAWLG